VTVCDLDKSFTSDNKSSPQSFGKSALLSGRRRMHSPTACASSSLYNA